MADRLKVNDTIIHRKFGRAKIRALSLDGSRATIHPFGGKPSMRGVWTRDCELKPRPLPKSAP